MEMKCYCEKHDSRNGDGSPRNDCLNVIPYKHHHDWGNDSDFMCDECIENCLID